MTTILALILLISFVASMVRSTLGFGESLVAVPLFLFFLPLEIAVPLSVMLSIVIALMIVIQDYQKIYFRSARWLVIYATLGIPIGLIILLYGNEMIVKTILGILIISYALYSLFNNNRKVRKINSKWTLFICGFLSGIFGAAYGLNGPPLVVYGHLKQWPPKQFRATLQAYFLPASLIGFLSYFIKGLVTTEVINYFLWSLLATIPAVFLGRYLNHKLKTHTFFKYVYWGLVVVGILLILNEWKD